MRGERLCASPRPGLDCAAQTMLPRHEVRPPREDMMTKSSAMARRISRRKFMAGAAGAGTALASNLAAPGLLAQTRAPLRLGNLNSFTGATPCRREQSRRHEPVLRRRQLDVGGRKIGSPRATSSIRRSGCRRRRSLSKYNDTCRPGQQRCLAVLAATAKGFYVVSGAGTDAITGTAILSDPPRFGLPAGTP